MRVPTDTAPLAVVVATAPVVLAAAVSVGVVFVTDTFLMIMVAMLGPWMTRS